MENLKKKIEKSEIRKEFASKMCINATVVNN